MASVLVGVPIYDQLIPQALPGLILATQRHQYTLHTEVGSLLALMFNSLWCAALNQREKLQLTHFAMHHADIEAEPGWLDALIDEQRRVGADVLSVVVPIKDRRGLTSTGWQDPHSRVIRRFTMKEVAGLPQTFDAALAGRPNDWLVVNTGLWVCDFTRPWVEEACFSIVDAIVKNDRGRFCPKCLPEDWNFSGWCARQGLSVFATTRVKARHHGKAVYANDSTWGNWDTDRGDEAP
jgi:hypothetical protein